MCLSYRGVYRTVAPLTETIMQSDELINISSDETLERDLYERIAIKTLLNLPFSSFPQKITLSSLPSRQSKLPSQINIWGTQSPLPQTKYFSGGQSPKIQV